MGHPIQAAARGRAVALAWATALIVLGVVTLLAATGQWDPPAATGSQQPFPVDSLEVPLGADAEWRAWPAGADLPAVGDFVLRTTVTLLAGETDVAYGLLIGEPGEFLAVALSPLGYASVWAMGPQGAQDQFALQPWPHVRRGAAGNELTVSRQGHWWTIRVNGERLWQSDQMLATPALGFYANSSGDEAVVAFADIALFWGNGN